MKIQTDPRLPIDAPQLAVKLTSMLRDMAHQINLLSEGFVQGATNAYISQPTTGKWRQGDIIRNRDPVEQGAAGGKYVVTGWACLKSGDFGSATVPIFVPLRSITGN